MAGSTKVAGLMESKVELGTTVIIMGSSVKASGRKANARNG
jgi:hypothetical protein